MRKKILMIAGGIMVVLTGITGFSAFEAHIINVTAHIENALYVSPEEISFGTVFPQEYLEREITISLSNSFMSENRVDDVLYVIKQKPKPKNPEAPVPDGFASWHDYCAATLVDLDNCYPLLCPYLSKTPDNNPENDTAVLAFHDPQQLAYGRLAKSEQDIEDIWTIDLDVPCFDGMCAQDWTHEGWELPLALEHEDFGCDLWIEVTNISETNEHNECIPEVCNGIDDDCDLLIDEDGLWANKGESCSVGVGECEANGVYICNDSDPSGPTICSAVAGSPTEEICDDGLDNDCDGVVDEENCVPEDVCTPDTERQCDTGEQGVCAAGTQTCTEQAVWGECVQNEQPGAELCDNLDNDCDGNVDEGLVESCPLQVGVCSGATKVCASGSWSTCDYGPYYESGTEITCDDLDNDCDGITDENVCPSANNWTYEQKFNTLTSGDLNGQDLWIGSADFDVQESITYEGDKAVACGSGSGLRAITRAINPVSSGNVYIAMRLGSIGSGGAAGFSLEDVAGNDKIYVRFRDDSGHIQALSESGTYKTIYPNYSLNTWYVINIEFDNSSYPNQVRMRVYNGSVWSSWTDWFIVFNHSYGNIQNIRMVVGSNTSFYLDTITPNTP
jgi:hypothetical protein